MTDDEPWTVHTAGPPVGLTQACSACGHVLQDNTAWAEGRVAVPEGDRAGMTWWPTGEPIAQLGICTIVLPVRPLADDERLCSGGQLMAGALTVAVGVHHGDGCTCTPLDEITRTVTVRPVAVSPDCPRQREIPRTGETAGRVAITWPARKSDPAALPAWGVAVHDADTGEQLANVTGLRMAIGTRRGWDGPVEAELEQLVDQDGRPLAAGAQPVQDEAGDSLRTAVFRYAVAEMRIAEA